MFIDFEILEVLERQAYAAKAGNNTYVWTVTPDTVLLLIAEIRGIKAERDWLAARIHHDGYLSCPGGKVSKCHEISCKNCWLKAASDAIQESML